MPKITDDEYEAAWIDVGLELLRDYPAGTTLGDVVSEDEMNRLTRARVIEARGYCDHPGFSFDEEISLIDTNLDGKCLN